MEKFDKLVSDMKKEFPMFCLYEKDTSKLSKFIFYAGLVFLWCPRWMTDFTHTGGPWIWMPKKFIGTEQGYRILRHERVHMRDSKRWPILFQLSYILLPVGPAGRAYWEFRAYKESMRAEYEAWGQIPDASLDWYCDQFTGSNYLWMWPFKKDIRARFERARQDIINGR